jgi:hypothetical protein
MPDTWAERLNLTHCGECGNFGGSLYLADGANPEERERWLCFTCWRGSDASPPRFEATSDEPCFALEAERPEVRR